MWPACCPPPRAWRPGVALAAENSGSLFRVLDGGPHGTGHPRALESRCCGPGKTPGCWWSNRNRLPGLQLKAGGALLGEHPRAPVRRRPGNLELVAVLGGAHGGPGLRSDGRVRSEPRGVWGGGGGGGGRGGGGSDRAASGSDCWPLLEERGRLACGAQNGPGAAGDRLPAGICRPGAGPAPQGGPRGFFDFGPLCRTSGTACDQPLGAEWILAGPMAIECRLWWCNLPALRVPRSIGPRPGALAWARPQRPTAPAGRHQQSAKSSLLAWACCAQLLASGRSVSAGGLSLAPAAPVARPRPAPGRAHHPSHRPAGAAELQLQGPASASWSRWLLKAPGRAGIQGENRLAASTASQRRWAWPGPLLP